MDEREAEMRANLKLKVGRPRGRHALVALALLPSLAMSCRGGQGEAEALQEQVAAGLDTPRSGPLPPAGHAWVIFGADTVLAEVAATADERAEGLMYREAVPDGTGMLFVFPDSEPRAFWMANTYVALDVAYMDPSYRIVDVIAMEPLVTESYPSDEAAMFALEVRQGWLAEQGIGIGDQAEIVFGVQGR